MAVAEQQVKDFIDEVIAAYKKHGLSISHEDTQGAFVIQKFSEANVSWLRAAHIETERK